MTAAVSPGRRRQLSRLIDRMATWAPPEAGLPNPNWSEWTHEEAAERGGSEKALRANADAVEAILLEGVRFRPGWGVSLSPDRRSITVSARVQDSSGGGEITVSHGRPIPPWPVEDHLLWLFEKLVEADLHEAMEFFTVGGRAPYYPHRRPRQNPYVLEEGP